MIAAESDFDVVSVYCLVESTLVSQISLVSLISLVSQISLVSLVREGPLKFPRCKKPPAGADSPGCLGRLKWEVRTAT